MTTTTRPGAREAPPSNGPVTPVRYDVDRSRPAGVGAVPSSDGGPVALRCALDWLTVLCRRPVSPATWERLDAYARAGGAVTIASDAGPIPMEWRRIGRDLCARSVAGVRVLVREPSSATWRELVQPCIAGQSFDDVACAMRRARRRRALASSVRCGELAPPQGVCVVAPTRLVSSDADLTAAMLSSSEGEERRAVYGIEVQVQGTCFSAAVRDGSELARQVWRAIAGELLRDQFPGRSVDVAACVDGDTRTGRVDVAVDVAFTAPDGAAWVQWGIYAHGDHDGAVARWSTRARKHRTETTTAPSSEELHEVPLSGRTALLGKATAGRTLYVGSAAYSLACIYERSKKRDGDWPILEKSLRAAGWDGESAVVRAEFRVSRAWMRDQVVRGADGAARYVVERRFERGDGTHAIVTAPRAIADLTIGEFLDALPVLAREFPTRFRHTDPHDARRVRDRASSSWWASVLSAAHAWCPGASADLGALVSVRREAALVRAMMRVRTGIARLLAMRTRPGDDWGRAVAEVFCEVQGAFFAENWRDERDKIIARTRERYAIEERPPPPVLPEDDEAWLAAVS